MPRFAVDRDKPWHDLNRQLYWVWEITSGILQIKSTINNLLRLHQQTRQGYIWSWPQLEIEWDFCLGILGLRLELDKMTHLTLQLQSAALLHNDLSWCRLIHDLNIWRSCNWDEIRYRDTVWGVADMFVFWASTGAQGVWTSVSISYKLVLSIFIIHNMSGSDLQGVLMGTLWASKQYSNKSLKYFVLLTPPLISMLNVCSMGGVEATWQVSWPASSLLTSVTVSVLLESDIWTE